MIPTPTLGEVVCCTRCQEEWPADPEFFFRTAANPNGLSKYCKACYAEMPSGRRKAASAKRVPHLSSPWEALFPECAPVREKVRKPMTRSGARQ